MALENPNVEVYPSVDVDVGDLVENLSPEKKATAADDDSSSSSSSNASPSAPPATEEILITVPGAILHLIDKEYSVELACGNLTIVRLRQDENIVAVYADLAGETQWPLAKDEAAVKVDDSHYFFSFRVPIESDDQKPSSAAATEVLSYGLTIASKGQEDLLLKLDEILNECSCFTVHEVSKDAQKKGEALDGSVAADVSPEDMKSEEKQELMEEMSAAYWTTLAPNVEEYNGTAARLIATGSGQLIKGILWCGDVTVERLKWGNEFLKQRMAGGSDVEVSPQTMKRIKRVKKVTKVTEKVANGVLSGVVRVSGFFATKASNSKAGKKFIKLLPEEVVIASLDGFIKVCDAVEVTGKNVLTTSSTVTTELVQHRYGEEAAKAANEGLDAAGHAVGAAWATFKIRQAFTPKSLIQPVDVSKVASKELEARKKKAK
ncbi:senescence/dehydration-associated protein At3g51250-like [Arachis duranensis]|uniref:Senescence/dehydration-associated protein At3g51250 n=1 Tax=Arachis duranensis TaxID=130453 RepID=A0A6P4CNI8_ARADU|nr:senescence/dehydration-associated protein At3g51250 [Arachis duranensis]XP_052117525.1 senescence/dehydration-associated protein At3g51250-like [Arachis duranensis]